MLGTMHTYYLIQPSQKSHKVGVFNITLRGRLELVEILRNTNKSTQGGGGSVNYRVRDTALRKSLAQPRSISIGMSVGPETHR